MKNMVALLLFIGMPAFFNAQNSIDASISYASFQNEGKGYIEIYMHLLGESTGLSPTTDSSGNAIVDVVILFKKGNEVVKFDKFRLNGPTVAKPTDFMDVKRYSLANDDYKLEVSLEDVVRSGNSKRYESSFSINYQAGELAISDIELVASKKNAKPGTEANPMVKGNLILEPMPTNFYEKNDELLLFYHEIYNADRIIGGDYVQSFFIDNADTNDKLEAISVAHKRKQAEPISAALNQIDIKELPSGNYNLVIELRNKDRQLLIQKAIPFQRSNPYLNLSREDISSGKVSLEDEFVGKLSLDELIYSLKAIMMHVDNADGEHVKLITSERNVNAMRLYLLSYWAKESATNPEGAYNAYMKVAKQVDVSFANGFGYGFETDRGYVFLKYGPPNNTVFEENEPSAPPYEIWFYNQFPKTGQNNVKFLFYNPSLVTNGHKLLHSTARGETNNPRWEVELYRASPNEIQDNNIIDGTTMQSNTGRQARRLFESY